MSEEANRLDRDVSELLAGGATRTSDPTLLWLAAAVRPMPPPGLVERIDRLVEPSPHPPRSDRPGRLLRVVAAALAVAFLVQGVGNLVAGEWVAQNLGEAYGQHAFFEGGIAMIAAAVCAAAAVVSRAWSTVSILTCSPLAVGLGVRGVGEVGMFVAGAALHLTEGVLGIALFLAWWLDRRDTGGSSREVRA